VICTAFVFNSNNLFAHAQGGSFPFGWRSAVKRYLSKAATAPISRLDR
jgi:hypothetical protein